MQGVSEKNVALAEHDEGVVADQGEPMDVAEG
jgi:hypothetical protein